MSGAGRLSATSVAPGAKAATAVAGGGAGALGLVVWLLTSMQADVTSVRADMVALRAEMAKSQASIAKLQTASTKDEKADDEFKSVVKGALGEIKQDVRELRGKRRR